jgi:hypothetical protein
MVDNEVIIAVRPKDVEMWGFPVFFENFLGVFWKGK